MTMQSMLPDVITVADVYFPVILGFLAATALIYFMGRRAVRKLRLYRYFWHPALAGAATFVIILSCLLLVFRF